MTAPPLPTGIASPEELLEVHAQLEGLLQLMRARAAKSTAPPGPSGAASQAQGRQGRYKKVDTARKSFILTAALPSLRIGKLPSQADWEMLFGPHDDDLNGAARTAAHAWAERHHRDPRSTASLPEAESGRQRSLLEWVERNPEAFMKPVQAPAGAPPEARINFGCYSKHTVMDLIRDGTKGQLVPGAVPGAMYLRWICSAAFNWEFPRHLPLLVSLIKHKRVPVANADGGVEPLDLSDAIAKYQLYARADFAADAGVARPSPPRHAHCHHPLPLSARIRHTQASPRRPTLRRRRTTTRSCASASRRSPRSTASRPRSAPSSRTSPT